MSMVRDVGVTIEGCCCADLKFMEIIIFSISRPVECWFALNLLLEVLVSRWLGTRGWLGRHVGWSHRRDVDVGGGCG